jgi:hypothetical protein
MNEMNITSAQYFNSLEGTKTGIKATINAVVWSVPLEPGNRHYDEIMRQVAAGTLTIADAD